MKSVSVEKNGIIFEVNYYTELLGVIGILSDKQDYICKAGTQRNNAWYHNEVTWCFNQYRSHKIIGLLETFSEEYNFNYDAPVELVLRIGEGQSINGGALCFGRKYIEDEIFEEFVEAFEDFEYKTNFENFYTEHREYYIKSINAFIEDYDKYSPLSWLINEFADLLPLKHHINLMHSVVNSNYGILLDDRIVVNIRPYFETRNQDHPDFSYNNIYWTTLIVHEFSHGFVNPIVLRANDFIKDINIEPYSKILDSMCYGNNMTTYIYETVIRAIECLYVKRFFEDQFFSFQDEYYNDGFIKIRKITDIIESSGIANIENYIVDIINVFKA